MVISIQQISSPLTCSAYILKGFGGNQPETQYGTKYMYHTRNWDDFPSFLKGVVKAYNNHTSCCSRTWQLLESQAIVFAFVASTQLEDGDLRKYLEAMGLSVMMETDSDKYPNHTLLCFAAPAKDFVSTLRILAKDHGVDMKDGAHSTYRDDD